mgnify:FL=1
MRMSNSDVVIVEDDDLMGSIGKNWWILLALGAVTLILGIWAVVNTASAGKLLAVIFIIWLIVSGIFSVVRGFAPGLTGGMRTLYFIVGALSILLGLLATRAEVSTGQAGEWLLGIFIGVAFLFQGLAALLEGFSNKDGRGWNIFFGVILLIGSVIVLVNPVASYGVVVWIAGIWLIIIGIFEIVAAFRVKSAAKV